VCQFLIDNGLDVNNVDTYGQNPIFYAVSMGNLETCKLLKENGSDHDMKDEMFQTPLHYAIKESRENCLRWLLD
jgi:ankyrin repeat protein